MKSNKVAIELPSGVIEVKRDGSDFEELPNETQREICLFVNSLLDDDSRMNPSEWRNDYKPIFLYAFNKYETQQGIEHQEISRDMLLSNYEHVEHPNHYNTYPVETIAMMVAIWGKEKVANFCEINAFKYRMRMGTKPDNSIEQDLKKEQWYLNKAKELRNEME